MPKFNRVLIRADFNVPLHDQKILDHSRIEALLPEIRYWHEQADQIILISHLGRPNGVELAHSLKPVAAYLTEKLGVIVPLCDDGLEQIPNASICLLENIRFHSEEYADDPLFAQQLAHLADHFVFDAFSVAHRRHASCHEIFKHVSSYGFGKLYQREVAAITQLHGVKKKRAFLIGGAKTETKIKLLSHLLEMGEHIFLGGVIGHTFLAASGVDMTGAKYDQGSVSLAKQILEKAMLRGVKIHLPVDAVNDSGEVAVFGCGQTLLDIGPETLRLWQGVLQQCEQVVWNGPLGYYEDSRFDASHKMADFLAKLSVSVMIGGGDTLAVIANPAQFDHVSTGGGAFLYYLEKQNFPHTEFLQGRE